MKKLIAIVFLLLTGFMLAACEQKPRLKIFMPGEYIEDDLIYNFEKEHQVRVEVLTFLSNEEALVKLNTNHDYDIIIPSDYMIEHLIEQKMIQELDWTKIDSFNKDTDLAPTLKLLLEKVKNDTKPLDLLKYTAPYFWGSVGLIYNVEKVAKEDINLGWDLMLQNEKYDIAFYDSVRDSFMAALVQKGYSMNTESKEEIDEAAQWLKQGLTRKTGLITDEIFDDMSSGKYDVAMAYTGDGVEIMTRLEEQNSKIKLGFFIPEKGSNIWVDGMVLTKNANKELAYEFINYVLSKEAQEINIARGYISPRKDVQELQINRAGNDTFKALIDIKFRKVDDIYRYSEESKNLIDKAWSEQVISSRN